ncbi:hypothetical protein FRC12_019512 [Ceratobasidium sp. 428]|nr:hypothetical protein FRC12_019512 [Ceratobasidium sp. 428]
MIVIIWIYCLDPRGQAHVFGPLLALPPSPRAPSFPTIAALSSGIETATTNLESAVRGWHEVIKPNATALAGNIASAHRDSKAAPAPLQPLVYFLLARRREWECAKVSAPIVIRLMPHLALHARAGLQLDAAVSEFWDVEDHASTVDDAEREAVDRLHQRMLKGVVEASWIYKELLAFEKLSTEWLSILPGDWLTTDPLTLGRNLGVLVLQLAEWAEAAGKLDVHHYLLRKRIPHPQEILDGLKEWLTYAKDNGEDERGKDEITKGTLTPYSVCTVTSVDPVLQPVACVSPLVEPSATASTPSNVASDIPNAPSPPVTLVTSTESPAALNGDNAGDNDSSTPSGLSNESPRTPPHNADLVANPSDAAISAAANVVIDVAVPATVVPTASLPNPSTSCASKKSKATKVAATPRLTRNNAAATAAATATTSAPIATGSAANVSSRTRRANTKATGASTSKKGTKNK